MGGGGYGLAELLPGTNSEAQLGFDACEAGGDFLTVVFRSVGVVGVPRFVLAHEAGKFFAKKRQKLFRGRGHQEEDAGGNPLSAGFFCGGGEGFEFAFAVGNAWNKGRSQRADGNARIAEFADGAEAQVGTGSAWLEEAREARAQRCNSDVHIKARTPRDFLQHLDIAGNQIRFGDDGNTEAIMTCEFFEAGARDAVFALGGLIRIGRGANADVFRSAFVPASERVLGGDFARQQNSGVFLDKDLFFKGQAIQLHEFVCVARVTVFAGKFAAAIGIDGPVEGNAV